jgi:mRNA interferase RelE/StbE
MFDYLARWKTGLYCLRSGDYRIVYQVQDETARVLVIRAGHRREVYRELSGDYH